MDTSTLFSVAPTFPLDDDRLRERSRSKILRSPVSWGGLVAATIAGSVLGAGPMGFLLLYGGTLWGLREFWKRKRPSLDAASMRELIAESNANQDRELLRIIQRLETGGLPQYAMCLGRFLSLKRRIEGTLHQERHLSPFAPEIEKGVDGLCSEVCREITSLRERERGLGEVLTSRDRETLDRFEAARRDSHAAILHAYTSLYQVHAELLGLDAVKSGGPLPEEAGQGAAAKPIDRIVGKLREEADLLARAHARIRDTVDGGSGGAGESLQRTAESA